MAQEIRVEDALEAFRKRHGELADENILLRAQVRGLERRLAELEQQQPDPAAPAPASGDSDSQASRTAVNP